MKCVVQRNRKCSYPPHPPTEGNGNSERRGVQEEVISEGVGGCSL